MKKIKVLLAAAFSVFAMAAFAQSKTETFKVYGNCGMCKKRIDKAAAVDGVSKANWNKDTKIMSVTYDASKVSMDAIQKKIAGVGYDTEKFTADDKSYNQLPDCCQYDRKKTSKKSK
ncbi:Copper chaperone CopZ [Hydrobacter penzbergensis]|uniref:Copper chaperone CopZ n=1 Tax=Hydrobacter penzbergensis TaxID=1235997 RepID=A0A8X8IHW1_9BACT|nr:cation transporter [Hydrobacter penzbergensis]SDX62494.1 Copper chaperone CopZ [Hydrobacter penzbergensis]